MLKSRRKVSATGKIENIHALDASYMQGNVEDLMLLFKDQPAKIKELINAFPGNYHGQFVQKLQILDHKGGIKQFDDIVSSFSIHFILDAAPLEERFLIYSKIFSHLKHGGTFRFSRYPKNPDVIKDLEALKSDGIIQELLLTPPEGVLIIK